MIRILRNPLQAAVLGCTCTLFLGSTGMAATVTVTTETGAAMETEFGIRDDTGTRGYELAGAVVTAMFDDGSTEQETWEDFNFAGTGGVNGDRWSFFQLDTGEVNLVSDGRVMTGFSIDASTSQSVTPDFANPGAPDIVMGASLFDISAANEDLGEPGSTPGSSLGFPFAFTFGAPMDLMDEVKVTYSGAVNIKGEPAVGDLFTTMLVDFTGLESTGGGFTGSATYISDQDTLRVAGDLMAVTPSPVPLPAGLPLLLAGLGGLAILRRSRR